MKKTRNSFFAENNMNYQGFGPFGNNGYQFNSNINSNFNGSNPILEINERLSKIERQINRLEHRINNIEQNKVKSTDDVDINSNNMYMI